MKPSRPQIPLVVPLDDEHARMIAYARSVEGQARIAMAKAEIAAGQGIAVDEAYFEHLERRIAARVMGRRLAEKSAC